MNRKLAPDLNIVRKNSLRTDANIVRGKVQPLSKINTKLQITNSNKEPITEFPNSNFNRPEDFSFRSLVLGYLVLHWILVFDTWNFNCLPDCVNQAGLLVFGSCPEETPIGGIYLIHGISDD